ncbi:MAG: phosphoglucosamine mutase [Nitrospira sp. NTP1]|nr:phosphoglucosamine mutase [Nitrospira sp. NTP1]
MRRLFGTDGVRGVANLEPMTSEIAMQLGRAAAHIFMRRAGRHQVVIGKDTRLSGYMLESALTSGICSMGVDVLLVGPLPTPAIAFLTRSLRADAGVVISASHNPYQDNGIKFFSNEGFKLPDELEARIEQLIVSDEIKHLRPTADAIGKAYRIGDAEGRYIEFVKRSLPRDHCGAVHPERLQVAVRRHGAHIGIALDGDADRAIFVCEQGEIVDGDHVMAALGLDLHGQGRLASQTVVGTVMSNFGLELAMKKAGIQLMRTPVGDRYLMERMLADGYNFGGEQSGHFIFLDHNTTGDGLISALQILSLMKRTGKPLSELAKAMTAVPQILLNVQVKHKPDLNQIPDIQQAIKTAEATLNGSGRVLVRYSGTEALLRIMVEGERDSTIREVADHLADIVRARIG